ncbi:unnamed protein product, partial [Cuscuta epithymum]
MIESPSLMSAPEAFQAKAEALKRETEIEELTEEQINKIYYEVVGGHIRARVYGTGSGESLFYGNDDGGATSTTTSLDPSSAEVHSQVQKLFEQEAEQLRKVVREEMREQMKLEMREEMREQMQLEMCEEVQRQVREFFKSSSQP